jgi:hypothetical protein
MVAVCSRTFTQKMALIKWMLVFFSFLKMYTHFKKGKNCIKIVIQNFSNNNCASAIFFDCPAYRMVMLVDSKLVTVKKLIYI